MKLPENNILIEGSSGFIDSMCGIGDMSIIFDILRNKLYSNIIESIAREISCNARDANREVGKKDIPIEIHFPNAFDENYKICDQGPGISPKRMGEIYKNYGNSTKRDSNEYTGAFGLGSKTPLAYTNQFTIRTTNEESDTTVTRTYIFYIDKSKVGTISLVSEERLNLPTGTSIIIPVEEKDYQAFIDGTIKSTQYWPIKPLFFGIEPAITYPETVGTLLAENSEGLWKIYNNKKNNKNYYNYKAECLAIIDGIQYDINESFINQDDRWLLSCNVHLFFNIGELTLSASREQLQYDQNTIKLINDRIKLVQKELKEQVVDIVDQKQTYLEAVEFYTYISSNFYRALNDKNLTWKGYKIIGHDIPIYKPTLTDIKAEIFTFTKNKNNNKISIHRHRDLCIHINKNTEFYYNDIDPTHTFRNKNIKALESVGCIQIINYIKNKSYDDFVIDLKASSDKYFNQNSSSYYKHNYDVDNSFIFDIIKPKLLSSIIEYKIISSPRVAKPVIVKPNTISVHRYSVVSGYKLRDYFYKTNINIDEEEGCYVETVFKTNSVKTKSKIGSYSLNYSDLKEIKKIINIPIYSVKEKDIPKLTKLKPLLDVLKEKFDETINTNYYKSIAACHVLNNYDSDYYNSFAQLEGLRKLLPFKNKILNLNNLILNYFEYLNISNDNVSISFLEKMEGLFNQDTNINSYVEEVGNLLGKIKSRYPLLDYLYNVSDYEKVIEYVNMCDELNNQEILKIAESA